MEQIINQITLFYLILTKQGKIPRIFSTPIKLRVFQIADYDSKMLQEMRTN